MLTIDIAGYFHCSSNVQQAMGEYKMQFSRFYWTTCWSTIADTKLWSNTMTETNFMKPSFNYAKNVRFTTNYRTSGFIVDTWSSYIIVFNWFVNSGIAQIELLVRRFTSITPVFADDTKFSKKVSLQKSWVQLFQLKYNLHMHRSHKLFVHSDCIIPS